MVRRAAGGRAGDERGMAEAVGGGGEWSRVVEAVDGASERVVERHDGGRVGGRAGGRIDERSGGDRSGERSGRVIRRWRSGKLEKAEDVMQEEAGDR
ncbi:hypothetical protein BOVATA_046600 [Babesia ovata]|uniref:Uncharacterized protein n=1 Tax=Babesia ovata TaxID=189622 RepID=A0A2H6KJK2_9APIC|nr:uncharacterized protein BOVATA_046600 [Babesia ovata]GBE63167.1 hypothetical protein BOVATA_046600 [Babesia ovata]